MVQLYMRVDCHKRNLFNVDTKRSTPGVQGVLHTRGFKTIELLGRSQWIGAQWPLSTRTIPGSVRLV